MEKLIRRLAVSAVLFVSALLIENESFKLILFIVSYIFAGEDVVKRAVKNILRGNVFDENFLMAIASIGAFLIGDRKSVV